MLWTDGEVFCETKLRWTSSTEPGIQVETKNVGNSFKPQRFKPGVQNFLWLFWRAEIFSSAHT